MIATEILDGCACESGDGWLARLFDEHYPRLFRLARRLSTNADEAQDLVQDTFVRIARSRKIPPGRAVEEAWLVRVLVNLARDAWRRNKVRRLESATTVISTPSPEPAYAARMAVQAALSRLPPRRRAIVVLRELDDLDYETIGRMLGVSAVTVRWHLSRAHKELAKTLSE